MFIQRRIFNYFKDTDTTKEAQNFLGCTAVFLIRCRPTIQRCVLPPSSGPPSASPWWWRQNEPLKSHDKGNPAVFLLSNVFYNWILIDSVHVTGINSIQNILQVTIWMALLGLSRYFVVTTDSLYERILLYFTFPWLLHLAHLLNRILWQGNRNRHHALTVRTGDVTEALYRKLQLSIFLSGLPTVIFQARDTSRRS
jgi:hypothetical protein